VGGILRRSAEGHVRHWFAVLGAMLVAGIWVPLYGHKVGDGWLYGKGVFLPDRLGWAGALTASLSVLVLFYFFVLRLERKK